VYWRGYRDQWFFEGLANYCSLVILETQNRNAFQRVMSRYRENLLEKNKRGAVLKDAGPVSLGLRLSSSEFPNGYEAISYGRGTWLFHMLRHMLDDGQAEKEASSSESHFMRALRKLRERYAGKPVTTREALQIFADELPSSVRYEGQEKLEWFNEGWVNGTAIPHFELQGVKLSVKDHGVIATGSILQKDAPRELVTSVPLYARLAGNRRVFITRIFADGTESAFRVTAPAGTLGLLIDPEQTVLKN
jgi:aminopeptidase N